MNTSSKRIVLVSALTIALNLLSTPVATAGAYAVTNSNSSGPGSLEDALLQAQSDTNAAIDLSTNLGAIVLSGTLPEIENNLTINGNSNAISGSNSYRILFVNAPGATVQINDLTLSNGVARGGSGGVGYGGGGGGAGLGGAIFLNAGSLAINGVCFSNNSAIGGAGGLGFDSGLNETNGGGGGGGGLNFSGGASGGGTVNNEESYEGPGGGGGALTSSGAFGNPDYSQAGGGGGLNGGAGGSLGLNINAGDGGSPSLPDGGGGGGGLASGNSGTGGNGGNGSDFGGGGGAGSGVAGNTGHSGNGGFGGGGGGGAYTPSGAAYAGGNGGFGGGGGGGGLGYVDTGSGGIAGFGGGGGASGSTGNAGGGLGAGGAIFARLGSTLTVQNCSFNGDKATGGSSTSAATNGAAIGQAMFLGANVNYCVPSGTNALPETIGGGSDTNASGSFTKSGAGTLVISGGQSYTGGTTISNGTLEVSNAVLPSTAVQIGSGAVLDYYHTIRILSPNTTYTGTGTLRQTGSAAGNVVFGPGLIHVNFSAGALIDVEAGILYGSSSYGGIWANNEASVNVVSGATFDAVEAGFAAAMQIDALTGAGIFQGGYVGNANHGLTTLTIGVAGGSGTFSGILRDDANARLGLVKTGAGTEILSGFNNTYSGNTLVNGGTLVVNGTAGSGSVTVANGVLCGTGRISGPVTITNTGTLAPGYPFGTLTISNSLTLAGSTCVALGNGTNSEIVGLTNVTYGGTLTVTNMGGPLYNGETFTLFSSTSWSNNFTNVVGNPGTGLSYVFNPANGVLSVVGPLPTTPTNLSYSMSSGALTVNWPASYTGWILQAQTNPPSVGITTNWTDVPGSALFDSMSFTVSPTNSVFFRMRMP